MFLCVKPNICITLLSTLSFLPLLSCRINSSFFFTINCFYYLNFVEIRNFIKMRNSDESGVKIEDHQVPKGNNFWHLGMFIKKEKLKRMSCIRSRKEPRRYNPELYRGQSSMVPPFGLRNLEREGKGEREKVRGKERERERGLLSSLTTLRTNFGEQSPCFVWPTTSIG